MNIERDSRIRHYQNKTLHSITFEGEIKVAEITEWLESVGHADKLADVDIIGPENFPSSGFEENILDNEILLELWVDKK